MHSGRQYIARSEAEVLQATNAGGEYSLIPRTLPRFYLAVMDEIRPENKVRGERPGNETR